MTTSAQYIIQLSTCADDQKKSTTTKRNHIKRESKLNSKKNLKLHIATRLLIKKSHAAPNFAKQIKYSILLYIHKFDEQIKIYTYTRTK